MAMETSPSDSVVAQVAETERCKAERVIKMPGYGESDLHCQAIVIKDLDLAEQPWHTQHYMVTEADGVRVEYTWA